MPVFEFRCATCERRFQTLVGVVAGGEDTACPHCGSRDTTKLVSRFARYRGEDDRLDEFADRLEITGEPDSSAESRRLIREMGKAMDEDASDELEQMFEEDIE
jgi:putative FmdB family regulatory protein